jgi:glycosyltransferase involved in cell wall biosynthesis
VRQFGYEVLVIDDGSSDQTYFEARTAGAHVLELSMNLGVGGALQCGFNYAIRNNFEAVIQLDADGQHPVDVIPKLIDSANFSNADIVLGSRFLHSTIGMEISKSRRIAMWILRVFASRACKTKISDSSSGFRLIRNPLLAQFAKSFPSHFLGDTFEALVISGRKNYKVIEIPAQFKNREFGESSATSWASVLLIFRALVVTSFGLHFQLPEKAQSRAD